jgi:hypothetical protein
LLLGDLLARLRRLIDQRGLAALLGSGKQIEPRASHVEEGNLALGVIGLLRDLNARGRMDPIFSGVWHDYA